MNQLLHILLIGLLLIFASCEKIVEFEEGVKTPKIVVNSEMTEGGLTVHLSNSATVIENTQLLPIDDALVEFYDESGFLKTLTFDGNGVYYASIEFDTLENYTLKVEANGYPSVEASSYYPEITTEIESVDTSTIERFDEVLFKIVIHLKDLGSKDHYYGIRLEGIMEDLSSNSIWYYPVDPVFDVRDYSTYRATFNNSSFSNASKSLELLAQIYPYYEPDSRLIGLEIMVDTFSEQSYLYYRSYRQYQGTEGDFFAEPVQVYSNISNGFGFFGATRQSSNYFIRF